ncbi:hypothetical protein HPB50_009639 [Hyalomma asiaticum]|uniref:Uncharacterized protein n=1 Tax=Hyalomma asiaticum TaxID=266040 RepID=A0ACB7T7B5_HYAAI|nr:hypothetical protein HPB50_009639 [Hyalomma asiaticum]
MREHDLRRLVQAFVLSRFVYSLPYLFLSRTEEDKVNCLNRQAYKSALSLPTSTSTDWLLSMSVHNSLTELTEAHRTAQLLRLSRTRPGRAFLSTLKLSPLMPLLTSLPIPSHVSSLLAIDPLPKNMHPEHHPSRRAARASALWRKFGRQPAVAYVDAAPYRHYAAHALAVTDNSLRPTITASVCTSASVEAEEAAIALAITQTSAEYIFSDSKPAVYNHAVGRVAPPAAGILRSGTISSRPIYIIWVPTHAGHAGNEAANSIARDSTDRASPPPPGMDMRDALLTYHDITLHYHLSRLTFPHHTNPFPSTNNTCGANFRPTPSLLPHVLPSSTPERTRRPAAYVAAPSPTINTYFTPVRHTCPLPLGTSEVRSSGRLLCPAPGRTCNFGW